MKRVTWAACAFGILVLGLAPAIARAQGVLPKGIGLYRFGYRSFANQSEKFDPNGELAPLGSSFNKDFDGENLLNGAGGGDLQRLARELKEFDGKNKSQESLVRALNLGRLHGDVSARVDAKIFALGYGVSDAFTLYGGIPFVSARVDTRLSLTGANNARAIKARLGDAAFDQLKDGLDRAAAITADDVAQGIMDKGYAPLDHWQRSGIGDVQVGGLARVAQGRLVGGGSYLLLLDSTLSLPTGYVEDPDVLTDVSFGSGGYASLTEAANLQGQWRFLSWGGLGAVTLGAPADRRMRLPEGDETLPDADRKTTVRLTPGHAYEVAGDAGLVFGAARTSYRLGFKRKFADAFTGSRQGNYAALAEGSDVTQTYSEVSATLDTSDLYKRKAFPVPFILAASYHFPHHGINSTDERFYELSLTSFFATPAAERASQPAARRRR